VRGSDQRLVPRVGDVPKTPAPPAWRAGGAPGRVAVAEVVGDRSSDVEPLRGDDGTEDAGGDTAPRSSDVALPRDVDPADPDPADAGGDTAPRSSDVALPTDAAAGGDGDPRSSDEDPKSNDDGAEPPFGGVGGPSRSRDVESVDLPGGGVEGAGPDRSSDVLADLSDRGGEPARSAAGRPAGAGPVRSSDVLAAAALPVAAGTDCGADKSSEEDLAGSDPDGVCDRPAPAERGE
jgi:hypothetical protein